MTAHELKDRFCLHDSSLISVTLTKKDEQVYAELNVTADDFRPDVVL